MKRQKVKSQKPKAPPIDVTKYIVGEVHTFCGEAFVIERVTRRSITLRSWVSVIIDGGGKR